jgi:hypothetical protein
MANTPHDHVHRLIRSMTRAEKRYFKLYTARHVVGGHSNHRTLFDAIAGMAEYDEAALLGRFAGEAFVHRFPITKRRLYEAILASLDAFHADSSVDARLRRQLHQVELLYQRTLYSDASRMLRSVRQAARQHDRQTILLDVLEWERRLAERSNYGGSTDADIDALTAEAAALHEELRQVEELWALKSRSFLILYRQGHVRDERQGAELAKLLEHPLLREGEALLTARGRFLHHHVRSAVAFAQGDLATCADQLALNHALLLAEQDRFKDEPNLRFSVLSNRIYVLSRLGRYQEADALLKEFRMLPATLPEAPTPDLEVKVFATSASLELAMLARSGDFTKAVDRSTSISERMNLFDAQLGALRKAGLLFQLAYVHFGAGDLDKALRYSHRQLSEGPVDEGTELHSFGRVLNLLIQLEHDKQDLLPYALRNTERYLAGRKRDLPVENAVLELVRQRMKARGPEAVRKAYEHLRDALLRLEQDPRERAVYDHFDPLAWVESKLTGRSFAQLVRERAPRPAPADRKNGRQAA